MRKKIRSFFTEDRYVLAVIALNALVLTLLSFPRLDRFFLILEIIDLFFLAYFVIEAGLKIRLQGWKRYISLRWNQFDFALIILSVPTVVGLIHGNWSDLSLVFVLRIARVARFFKFLRFVPNIKELLAGIRRAFKASVFVLLAFTLYGFVIALVSSRIFQHLSPEMFGDPLISFYHIFQVFTIEGWNDIPERIVEGQQLSTGTIYAIKLYFMGIVATGGLFGLSIVNAIFVEEMVRDNNDELELTINEMNQKLDHLMSQLSDRKNSNSHEAGN